MEGRFVASDNAFVLILLNRAGESPLSYYGYGKYILDVSNLSMEFEEVEMFKGSTSGFTVSHKHPWEGTKSFAIGTDSGKLQMFPADGYPEITVDGNTMRITRKGKVVRTYRRAGTK